MDLTGKVVAVTGAAGSIGSALVRSIGVAKAIRAIDIDEGRLHHLSKSVPTIRPILGDVRDREKMRQALSGAYVVFHCAALKHVGLGEYSADQLVAVNVVGTVNVANACHENGVKRLVLVSTDKASEPTSAMGASKLLAERVVSDLNLWSPCHGVAVRFGNVFGSRGSVVPTLLRQLARENQATITDPEATRFTMDIHKAVSLLVSAGTSDVPRGGIVVLKMPAYRLDDLGFAVVAVWNEMHPDAKATLKTTALQYGEKKHESLLSSSDRATIVSAREWIVLDPKATSGEKLSGSFWDSLESVRTERVERYQLVKWTKDYCAQAEKEMWE